MHPKTELFLYHLQWTAEQILFPTWRNLNETFEGWAHRGGFLRQVQRLEAAGFLERHPEKNGHRLYRLTERGRLAALGGRDPLSAWESAWDGRWRFVSYDVSVTHNATRRSLRRHLTGAGFGCLQGSLWISPRPLPNAIRELCRKEKENDLHTLVAIEGIPLGGVDDRSLVLSAWNFSKITKLWKMELDVLANYPKAGTAAEILKWAAVEQRIWQRVIQVDPLLPSALLPPNYPGKETWKKRCKILIQASNHLGKPS